MHQTPQQYRILTLSRQLDSLRTAHAQQKVKTVELETALSKTKEELQNAIKDGKEWRNDQSIQIKQIEGLQKDLNDERKAKTQLQSQLEIVKAEISKIKKQANQDTEKYIKTIQMKDSQIGAKTAQIESLAERSRQYKQSVQLQLNNSRKQRSQHLKNISTLSTKLYQLHNSLISLSTTVQNQLLNRRSLHSAEMKQLNQCLDELGRRGAEQDSLRKQFIESQRILEVVVADNSDKIIELYHLKGMLGGI